MKENEKFRNEDDVIMFVQQVVVNDNVKGLMSLAAAIFRSRWERRKSRGKRNANLAAAQQVATQIFKASLAIGLPG